MAEANPKTKQSNKKPPQTNNNKKQKKHDKKQTHAQIRTQDYKKEKESTGANKKKWNKSSSKSRPAPSGFEWGRGVPRPVSGKVLAAGHKQHTGHYYKLLERRRSLPIWEYKKQIIELIMNSHVVVIEGETGSGKSTQVPQWCLELPGMRQVVCTQPRRIAAISLAQRVAQEMDVRVGQEVGYVVRFERKVAAKTVLRYVTDGIMLRHVIEDRSLSSYDVIIIDEIHERRMVTDILLGVIKDILPIRSDLKVIIMSATLNVSKFCEFFDHCPHLRIPGKLHPIEMTYSPAVIRRKVPSNEDKSRFLPFVFDAINVVMEICLMEKTRGDILVFVSGREEIDYICSSLEDLVAANMANLGEIVVIPLYGDLPYNSQQRIFGPSPPSTLGRIGRKCIVSTNIAETSITIDGVVFVIDSGKVKLSSVVGSGHMKSLLPVDISQSSAEQRAGRAGRTQPGKCYRLYSKVNFDKLAKDTIPEILRCDLTSIILQLKVMGIEIERFESVDQPTPEAYSQAILNLKQLNALNNLEEVTSIGFKMARFPLDADVARMLVASQFYSCQHDMVTLAAILSCDRPSNVFMLERKEKDKAKLCKDNLSNPRGDHLTSIDVFNQFRLNSCSEVWCRNNFINYKLLIESSSIKNQLNFLMRTLGLMSPVPVPVPVRLLSHDPKNNVLKAILTGSLDNIARIHPSKSYKQQYIIPRDKLKVTIHPSSILDPKSSSYPILLYHSCIQTVPKQPALCIASIIDEDLILEVTTACKAEQQVTFTPFPQPLRISHSELPPIEILTLCDGFSNNENDDTEDTDSENGDDGDDDWD